MTPLPGTLQRNDPSPDTSPGSRMRVRLCRFRVRAWTERRSRRYGFREQRAGWPRPAVPLTDDGVGTRRGSRAVLALCASAWPTCQVQNAGLPSWIKTGCPEQGDSALKNRWQNFPRARESAQCPSQDRSRPIDTLAYHSPSQGVERVTTVRRQQASRRRSRPH